MNNLIPELIASQLRSIRRKIRIKYDSQGEFCFDIGQSPSFVSQVLNGYLFLDVDQIEVWSSALDLSSSDFPVPIRKNGEIIGWSNGEGDDIHF